MHGSKCRVQDEMQIAKCKMLQGARSEVQHARCKGHIAKYKMQGARGNVQDAKSKVQHAKCKV